MEYRLVSGFLLSVKSEVQQAEQGCLWHVAVGMTGTHNLRFGVGASAHRAAITSAQNWGQELVGLGLVCVPLFVFS